MQIAGYDEWLWRQADEYMSRNDVCDNCGEEQDDCECEWCADCKSYSCRCDEIYERERDRRLGL